MAQKGYWATWVKDNDLAEGALETASWDMLNVVFKYSGFDR